MSLLPPPPMPPIPRSSSPRRWRLVSTPSTFTAVQSLQSSAVPSSTSNRRSSASSSSALRHPRCHPRCHPRFRRPRLRRPRSRCRRPHRHPRRSRAAKKWSQQSALARASCASTTPLALTRQAAPDHAGGLGCNAGGQGIHCRFCGFGEFGSCPSFQGGGSQALSTAGDDMGTEWFVMLALGGGFLVLLGTVLWCWHVHRERAKLQGEQASVAQATISDDKQATSFDDDAGFATVDFELSNTRKTPGGTFDLAGFCAEVSGCCTAPAPTAGEVAASAPPRPVAAAAPRPAAAAAGRPEGGKVKGKRNMMTARAMPAPRMPGFCSARRNVKAKQADAEAVSATACTPNPQTSLATDHAAGTSIRQGSGGEQATTTVRQGSGAEGLASTTECRRPSIAELKRHPTNQPGTRIQFPCTP